MKKWWLSAAIGFVLVLGACGNETDSPDVNSEENEEEVAVSGNEGGEKEKNKDYNEKTGEGYLEGIGYVKSVGIGYNDEIGIDGTDAPLKPIQMGSMNLEIGNLTVLDIEPDEDQKELYFEGKEKVRAIVVNMKVENTSDEDVTFDPNQSTIVTSAGEQLEPMMFLSGDVGGDFLGKVKKEGQTWWMLNNKEEDVTSVKLIVPSPYKMEDWEDTAEEKRIEFEVITFDEAIKRDSSQH